MVPVALKMTLLLAVLVQCTPLRYCAVERVVLGSNCHDRGVHSSFEDSHDDDEATCGFPGGGGGGGAPHDECVCEQPKVDAQHDPQGLKSPLEWAHARVPFSRR